MANWGYALSQGLAQGAGAVGILADNKIKEEAANRAADRNLADQERLMAAREMMIERAEERKRQGNMKMGADIDKEAQGILAGERDQAIRAKYGGQTAAEFDAEGGSLPEERAAMATTDIQKSRAGVRGAEKLGYTDAAKERRGILDSDQRFAADQARAKNMDDKNDIATKKADADAEYKRGLLDKQDRREAAAAGRGKRAQVVDKDGNLRSVTDEEMNAPDAKYRPVSSLANDQKREMADEKLLSLRIKDNEKRLADMKYAASEKDKAEKARIQSETVAMKALYEDQTGKRWSGAAPTPSAAVGKDGKKNYSSLWGN